MILQTDKALMLLLLEHVTTTNTTLGTTQVAHEQMKVGATIAHDRSGVQLQVETGNGTGENVVGRFVGCLVIARVGEDIPMVPDHGRGQTCLLIALTLFRNPP